MGQHPPYPLVGIEWEPQLTLLNAPNCPVYVYPDFGATNFSLLENEGIAYLQVPTKYHHVIDVRNVEFRTPPVSLEELPQTCKEANEYMKGVIKEIARDVGAVGVFFPQSGIDSPEDSNVLPHKHVNISFPVHCIPGLFSLRPLPDTYCVLSDLPSLNYLVKLSPYYECFRLHIRVPYQFKDYEGLVEDVRTLKFKIIRHAEGPILLGYSITGEAYVEKVCLF